MLTNKELDLLLEVSDYLTSEESKGYFVLLSNFELDAQAKKFCERLQEARGRGTQPPSASEYFFDLIGEV